jgi:hypothetical protein
MLCPECGNIVKTVPAGISKRTGKPYNSFEVCSSQECGWKPPREQNGSPAPVQRQQQTPVAQKGAVSAPLPNAKAGSDPKAMLFSYAKDLIVAQMEAGIGPEHIVKATIWAFRYLWDEYQNPGSVRFTEDKADENKLPRQDLD